MSETDTQASHGDTAGDGATDADPTGPRAAGDPAAPPSRSFRLFDIRSVIGGVFVVYGLILAVVGLTASTASLEKSQGIDINLWTGLGCLIVGVAFLVWMALRPVATDVATDAPSTADR